MSARTVGFFPGRFTGQAAILGTLLDRTSARHVRADCFISNSCHLPAPISKGFNCLFESPVSASAMNLRARKTESSPLYRRLAQHVCRQVVRYFFAEPTFARTGHEEIRNAVEKSDPLVC